MGATEKNATDRKNEKNRAVCQPLTIGTHEKKFKCFTH